MRIYAVADVHGKSTIIEGIRKTISKFKPDVLVVAGDITNIRNSAAVIKQLNSMAIPVLAIRGNMDLPRVDSLLNHYPNTVCLHLKEHVIDGIHFAGVGGTIPLPFRSRLALGENRVLKRHPGGFWTKHLIGFMQAAKGSTGSSANINPGFCSAVTFMKAQGPQPSAIALWSTVICRAIMPGQSSN
jgi:hypothetical protein